MTTVRHTRRAGAILRLLLASAAGAALLPAGGCKRDRLTPEQMEAADRAAMAPVLAKHKDASTAQLAALKAVGADATAAPPVTAREAGTAALAPLPASGEPESVGVLLASPEWLAGTGGSSAGKVPVTPKLSLYEVTQVLDNGYKSGQTPDGMEMRFAELEGLKHVGVVRVRDYAPPKVVFAAGGRRFEGARAGGDVIVYDLATRKRVGAFPFEAAQRDTVSVRSKDEAGAQSELEKAFEFDLGLAVKKEYAAFAAGEAGPSAPGTADGAELKRFADRIKSRILQDHFLYGATRVEVAAGGGAGGKPLVTIWTDTTLRAVKFDEPAAADVVATVTKVLGRDAEVRVRPATRPATGPG